MRKVSIIFLCLILTLVLTQSAFAKNENLVKKSYTKEQILTLEKFVSVNNNGLFELNHKKARAAGIDKALLDVQQQVFNHLNKEVLNGNLIATKDLKILNLNASSNLTFSASMMQACSGQSTATETFWWGYSRYFDSCEADDLADNLAGVSAVSTGVAIIATAFGVAPIAIPSGLTAAYLVLLSSRVSANNNGSGVFIEMTWVFAFDVTPQ